MNKLPCVWTGCKLTYCYRTMIYRVYLILRSYSNNAIDNVMSHRVTYNRDIKCHFQFLHTLCWQLFMQLCRIDHKICPFESTIHCDINDVIFILIQYFVIVVLYLLSHFVLIFESWLHKSYIKVSYFMITAMKVHSVVLFVKERNFTLNLEPT